MDKINPFANYAVACVAGCRPAWPAPILLHGAIARQTFVRRCSAPALSISIACGSDREFLPASQQSGKTPNAQLSYRKCFVSHTQVGTKFTSKDWYMDGSSREFRWHVSNAAEATNGQTQYRWGITATRTEILKHVEYSVIYCNDSIYLQRV